MCFLSVECSCKHNIAIQNPNKSCIRPRHPKGCWLIRRGDPVSNKCPGCVEYFAPTTEQLTWSEVMTYHLDTGIDWSEATLSNVIVADRNRHNNCENDRLDFRRRLRWKLMIKWDLLPGWRLTERGVMVPTEDNTDDQSENNEANMQTVEPTEEEDQQHMMMTWDLQTGQEVTSMEPHEGDLGELTIGYALKRVSSGRLETVHDNDSEHNEEHAVFEMDENDEANQSFQLTSSTDTSTSSSNASVGSGSVLEDLGIGGLEIAEQKSTGVEEGPAAMPPTPRPKRRELGMIPRVGLTDDWLRSILPWNRAPSSEGHSTENSADDSNGDAGRAPSGLRAPPGLLNLRNGSTSNLLHPAHLSPVKAGGRHEKYEDNKEDEDMESDDSVDGGLDGAGDYITICKST
ncbi:hypothetical protein ABW21_db0202777 [Orbilia brochopaga]|nr:hypothetical protein ABW21_db0202777 [Drechslerella brochopaga]